MILVMSDSRENSAAAALLAPDGDVKITVIDKLKQGLGDTTNQLILLDIDNDDKMMRYLDPEAFAETLLKHGLSSGLLSVVFVVSDLNPDENLRTFSRRFIDRLEQEFRHGITAYVPTDLNYASTLIDPPSEQTSNWRIVGLEDSLTQSTLSLSVFKAIKGKKLLWEGTNILDWITRDEKAVKTFPDDIGKNTFAL